jgi:hypothetical protein
MSDDMSISRSSPKTGGIALLRFFKSLGGRVFLDDENNSVVGVSHNTIQKWISVLEASYIVHGLPPHHRNFNKRVIKTPKLYMLDSGLACWLLGIESTQQLAYHPLRGELFETAVVTELIKARWNRGLASNISFWRDRGAREADVIVDNAGSLEPIEIKSGATLHRNAFTSLRAYDRIKSVSARLTRKALGTPPSAGSLLLGLFISLRSFFSRLRFRLGFRFRRCIKVLEINFKGLFRRCLNPTLASLQQPQAHHFLSGSSNRPFHAHKAGKRQNNRPLVLHLLRCAIFALFTPNAANMH